MALDEIIITKAIIDRYYEKLINNLETDVAIVGGGQGTFLLKQVKKWYCTNEN
jgi:ribulose 1,5-bisphosphate synthetase/thiazole synthase